MRTKTTKQYVIALSTCLISSLGFSQNTCSFYSESYNSAAGWTTAHPVTSCPGPVVTINNNRFNFNSCIGGEENRMFRNVGIMNSFIADFDFFVDVNGTNAPAAVLAAFTTNLMQATPDPFNNVVVACDGGTFPLSNLDAIAAFISSGPNNTNWNFVAGSKDANNPWSMSATIPCPQVTGTYYIRLQRVNPSVGLLSVFTDQARTTHLVGSPQCFNITGSVSNISALQHANIPQGWSQRKLNGTIDNMCVSKLIPSLSGPSQAGCGYSPSCYPAFYTYTVTGVPGATITQASWTLPAGATNIVFSQNNTVVTFTFPPCTGPATMQVRCDPSFGSGTPCTIVLTKNVSMISCRINPGETETKPEPSYNLYPNPNNGSFTFNYEIQKGSTTNFEISDLTGRRIAVYELKEGTASLEIDQHTLEQGVYFYSIIQDGEVIKTEKFTVIN